MGRGGGSGRAVSEPGGVQMVEGPLAGLQGRRRGCVGVRCVPLHVQTAFSGGGVITQMDQHTRFPCEKAWQGGSRGEEGITH